VGFVQIIVAEATDGQITNILLAIGWDRGIQMSLDGAVTAIVNDENVSVYLRAIRLYELQVAIFYPLSFRALCAAETEARAADRWLRTARIYAGIRFLEQIESELRQARGSDTISISLLAQEPRFQTIFDNVIAPNGGWMRIRHSISNRTFDKRLAAQRDSAEVAAKIVDFSCRFEKMPDRGKYRGGVTAARYVVANARSYDVSGLRSFFRAYQNVCEVLARRGYTFEKLSLNLNYEVSPLTFAALEADVIAAFKDSLGAKE
jgi:hypothetical protein